MPGRGPGARPRRVVVVFPDDASPAVDSFRADWDPLAGSLPPHITLVHPADIDAATAVSAMRHVAQRVQPFEFAFTTPQVHDRAAAQRLRFDGVARELTVYRVEPDGQRIREASIPLGGLAPAR